MTLLHKPINLIPIAIVVVTAMSLVACTEKAADNTQAKKNGAPCGNRVGRQDCPVAKRSSSGGS